MRQEPSIGNLFGLFQQAPKLDHDKLVSDALNLFTEAEAKMNNAIDVINTSIEDDRKAIQEIEKGIGDKEQSMGKLSRVINRLKALTE